MSTNPIDNNPTPKPTGSLEELFRHHLGDEAAMPPRPLVWDQIDNSLLIRQNEAYRRRLVATRWVAAASLLLATLAGTGWWAGHESALRRPDLAASVAPATGAAGNVSAVEPGTTARVESRVAEPNRAIGQPASTAITPAKAPSLSAGYGTDNESADKLKSSYYKDSYAATRPASSVQSVMRQPRVGAAMESGSASSETAAASGTGTLAAAAARSIKSGNDTQAGTSTFGASLSSAGGEPAGSTAIAAAATNTLGATASSAGPGIATPATTLETATSAAPEQLSLLAARPAALSLTNPAELPTGLTNLTLPDEASLVGPDTHRWHYGASYTGGAFNPNINFSRAGIEPQHGYNLSPALGEESPQLTEAAAAQYRENLRPGFSQRLALLASRHLGGHWSLSTGVELGQATASSASTMGFVGEQLYDLGPASIGPMRTTSFRYRTAGLPLELQYANPVKRGWSIYGCLGGVVSALLGVRSDVEGNPEATRTYSITSAGTPYRRVLGSLRGSVGARYRSALGCWALSLGPVAELGLTPLNAHPAQRYFSQSRPYSFGLEAAMEFGR